MGNRLKGKWAQGIQPRNFTWVIKDRLAVCERPGGYGTNHRRVRRQEEIIWLREQGFSPVISIIPSPHNLHNYDELDVVYLHRPFAGADPPRPVLSSFYPELHDLLRSGHKVVVHGEEVGDRVVGLVGGYVRWAGLVPDTARAITVIEAVVGRQLDPLGRSLVSLAGELAALDPPPPLGPPPPRPAGGGEPGAGDGGPSRVTGPAGPADGAGGPA